MNIIKNQSIEKLTWKNLLLKRVLIWSSLYLISSWATLKTFEIESNLRSMDRKKLHNQIIILWIVITFFSLLWSFFFVRGIKKRDKKIFEQFEEEKNKILTEARAEIRELKCDLVLAENRIRNLKDNR